MSSHPLVTPSRPPPPVDMSTIEQSKENILPLASGRSARQLATLSSQSRSGLGSQLAHEHKLFQAKIDAVALCEETGEWDEGRDGLSRDEVLQLAEDPLEVHHQYAKFALENYTAGASTASKLVPLLEASTRRFLDYAQYRNDARYLRLWSLYASNTEDPEMCYRFLFAKGIGEELAILYEEYAKVLEANGKREQADSTYRLGISRKAAPLVRLTKQHRDFTARMLVAPPLPSPPRGAPPGAAPASSGARSILAGAGMAPSGVGSLNPSVNGGASAFAIFRDDKSSKGEHAEGAEWEDLGTVKSRKRENDVEAKEWKGETMPMAGASASKPGMFKLEVFRDSDATTPARSSADAPSSDVFSRSQSVNESDLIRRNPFKNYSSADVDLTTRDPLDGVTLPPPTSLPAAAAPAPTTAAVVKPKKKSSSSSSKTKEPKPAPVKPTSERTWCDLSMIYPSPGVEYSFEELKAMKHQAKYGGEAEKWNGWEWNEQAREEMRKSGKSSFVFDPVTSWPLTHDAATGEPLWDFLPRPSPPTPVVPSPAPVALAPPAEEELDVTDLYDSPSRPSASQQSSRSLLSPSPPPPAARQQSPALLDFSSPAPASTAPPTTQSPFFAATQEGEARLVEPLSPSPVRAPAVTVVPIAEEREAEDDQDEAPPSPLNPRRPPSPTINTRAAQAMIDGLFSKTLDFGKIDGNGNSDSDEDDSDGEEPDTESDEDNDQAYWAGVPVSQLDVPPESQFTQSGSQESEIDPPFVPFSQAGTDSLYGPSQFSQLEDLQEEDENSPHAGGGAGAPRPPPMQLFRDSAAPTPATPAGLFRPTAPASSGRAPFGAKTPLGASGAKPGLGGGLFAIHRDEPSSAKTGGVFGGEDEHVPSSQHDEDDAEDHEDSFEDFEAPLEGGEDEQDEQEDQGARDGFNWGRRPRGEPSRYAPFIDNMTPITERTLEYTMGGHTSSSLSTSQRSRRDSAFQAVPLVEEDEDEDEDASTEDEDDDGDRAFVAYEQEQDDDDDESDRTRGSNSSSDEDPDTEDEAPRPLLSLGVPPVALVPASTSMEDSSADWRDSTRKDGQFDVEADSSIDRQGGDRSFDASLNTSLPEGFTITGNQSGMTTGMVLAETTSGTLTSTSTLGATIDPFIPSTLHSLLARVSPPVLEHPSVRDFSTASADNLTQLQKTAKKREGKSKAANKDRTGVIDDLWAFELGDEIFSVREKLGEGSYGAVFRVVIPSDEDDSFDAEEDEESSAVKIEQPPNLWEFHVLDQLHLRLPERIRDSVVRAHRMYAFADESYLFLDFCDQGTLLDAVNHANESGVAPPTGGVSQGLDEVVAIFFVVELLRTLEGFHSSGFIHGDLKIDNCLVRLEDVVGGAKAWSTSYDPSGAGGWRHKGIKLIDFGRTIDTTKFPAGQQFSSSLATDQFDCVEMREGRPWTYQGDYFGAASIAYNVLFGRYIETKQLVDEQTGAVSYAINQNFRRYHQADLWGRLFDALLNPTSVREDHSLPIIDELAVIRMDMEAWLSKNSDKNGKSLKGLIKKMEIHAMSMK